VLAYERFLTSGGGPRGGWRSEDHETFLRVARQLAPAAPGQSGGIVLGRARVPALAARLLPLIPGLDEESLAQHVEWYEEHERLRRGRKEAIRQWKREAHAPPPPPAAHDGRAHDDHRDDSHHGAGAWV
jgi:hypothetical protein